MANGLPNRTIKTTYYGAKVLFNSLKCLKDMSDSEKLIKNLHSIHKNKWTKIALKCHFYPFCVMSEIVYNYNSNGEPYNKGQWSRKENKKLLKGIKLALNTNHLSHKIYAKNIPWI